MKNLSQSCITLDLGKRWFLSHKWRKTSTTSAYRRRSLQTPLTLYHFLSLADCLNLDFQLTLGNFQLGHLLLSLKEA